MVAKNSVIPEKIYSVGRDTWCWRMFGWWPLVHLTTLYKNEIVTITRFYKGIWGVELVNKIIPVQEISHAVFQSRRHLALFKVNNTKEELLTTAIGPTADLDKLAEHLKILIPALKIDESKKRDRLAIYQLDAIKGYLRGIGLIAIPLSLVVAVLILLHFFR